MTTFSLTCAELSDDRMTQQNFASQCADVRNRYQQAKADDSSPRPEYPFCLVRDSGQRIDAMQQLRGTLAALLAMVFAIASAITALFTVGIGLWVVAAIAGIALVMWLLHRRRLDGAGKEWLQQARPYPAALIMAEGSLHRPGDSVVPGALLVDFGDTPDPDRLREAAEALYDLTDQDDLPPAHAAVREWLHTEMGRARYGRRRAPSDLTGNDSCWLVSLRLDRAMMPKGFLDRALWFVLARPDRSESAELLPPTYWAAPDA